MTPEPKDKKLVSPAGYGQARAGIHALRPTKFLLSYFGRHSVRIGRNDLRRLSKPVGKAG